MAKLKKGTKGNATKYIARTQAVRKLQISLSQFRRLCILKGIYPIEPKNKRKVNNNSTQLRTFYYKKDIQYLFHEPILQALREEKIHSKKLGKAIGKKEYSVAKQLFEDKPVYRLDHIIKERYPSFQDALRDLDDALSMVALFSTLPSNESIPEFHVKESYRLYHEFLNYCVLQGCLKKTFLSIKGIYYQVEIMGQSIIWIAPYQFSQNIPQDVDFKVMKTFLEINETLLSFVNYKLYMDLGFSYPPKMDLKLVDEAGGLSSLVMESKNVPVPITENAKNIKKRIKTLNLDAIEQEEEDDEMQEDEIMDQEEEGEKVPGLFSNCVFFLSREVPRYSLEFVIKSMGGKVCWDPISGSGSVYEPNDPRITHHLTDRPNLTGLIEGREYLQPQWIYDCINQNKLLKTNGYHPSDQLPPHLSPFVQLGEDDYDPQEQLEPEIAQEEQEKQEQPELDVDVDVVEQEQQIQDKESKHSKKENKELAKIMMSKRERKLYDKIQFGKKRKQDAAAKIRDKRK